MALALSFSELHYNHARRVVLKPVVASSFVIALLVFSLLRLAVFQNALANEHPAALPISTTAGKPKQSKTSTTSAGVISILTPKAALNSTPTTATCTPTNYSAPSALVLTNAPAGLTKVIDAPTHYTIFGNQPSELRSQIQQCAMKTGGASTAQYVSETGAHLSWQYNYANIGNNMCTIQNAKIGMHINQIMPLWLPNQNAASGLSGKWQTFMANLTTHENGHIAIDEQYAAEALSDMQHFPATNCDTIVATVDYIINADVNMLNEANDNYDATTNHGATQGAILP